jgi:hypothetical protein
MIKTKRSFRGKKRSVIAVTGLLVSFIFTATGCSQVPEYVNPIEWYKDTKAWITGEESGRPGIKKIERNSAQKGTDFPELASVPERPNTPSRSDFKKMASGLIADRASARYSDCEPKRKFHQGREPRKQVPRILDRIESRLGKRFHPLQYLVRQ